MQGDADRDRADSLEVGEVPTFSRYEARAQLAGSVLILALVILALLGLFGVGVLSDTSAGAAGLRVDYPRFVRYRAPEVITLRVTGGALAGDALELWFERSFVQEARVENVSPEPKDVAVEGERVTYTFAITPGASSATVVLWLQPEHIGPLGGDIGIEGGSQVTVNQFVYP